MRLSFEGFVRRVFWRILCTSRRCPNRRGRKQAGYEHDLQQRGTSSTKPNPISGSALSFLPYEQVDGGSPVFTGTSTAHVLGVSIQIWLLGMCASNRLARHFGPSLRAITRKCPISALPTKSPGWALSQRIGDSLSGYPSADRECRMAAKA